MILIKNTSLGKYIPYFVVTCIMWPLSLSNAQIIPQAKKDTAIVSSVDDFSSSDRWIYEVKGFVQADYMFNTQEIGSKDGFLASSIVMPQSNKSSSYFSIRQSQLGLGVRRNDNKLSAYIEIDLFGQNGTTAPRLRKAYITYGKWLFGQDWSNLSDLEIWPNIFDFLGPNAPMLVRRIQLRYTTGLTKKSKLSLSLEDPDEVSITLPDNSLEWKKKTLIPSFTMVYRYGGNQSYIRIATILAPISYEMREHPEDLYTLKTILGGGVNLTGALYLNKQNSLKFHISYGTGVSTNNGALNNEGYDAVYDRSRGNKLRALPFFSTSAAYEHWWNSNWSSVFFYSYSKVGGSEFIQDGMIENFQNAGANIIYQPFKKFRIGIEGHYGILQKYKIKETSRAFRCQLSTALNF